MTPASSVRRAPDRQRRDSGISLIELLVAMAILGIVMTIVTGAIVSMYRATDKVEGVTTTSAQIGMALSKLDASVRYAAEISDPQAKSGDWYVTYRSTYSGVTDCTQLRFNSAKEQLQRRTWSPPGAPSSWVPIASDIELAADGTAPFTVGSSIGTEEIPEGHQQLRLRFDAVRGSGQTRTVSSTDVTFTSFNAVIGDSISRAAETGASCEGVTTP